MTPFGTSETKKYTQKLRTQWKQSKRAWKLTSIFVHDKRAFFGDDAEIHFCFCYEISNSFISKFSVPTKKGATIWRDFLQSFLYQSHLTHSVLLTNQNRFSECSTGISRPKITVFLYRYCFIFVPITSHA